ncbi:hypothetical protein NXF25_016783 [Crotalus adamanteus]|uniref:Alpha-ketoglutarate-dependent dioxygenase FTO C-terminal domain-containing protein n=1 Tax=Crotalus adamanteus TaxID=8729 RepID=A0AAW1AT10_CROAD
MLSLECSSAINNPQEKDVLFWCHSSLSENLPEDEKPKCQPYWQDKDPSMPLPFNLDAIIFELQTILEE